ncbi:MAG: acyltransferase family protein [Janthinobacterium lividum]
MKELRQLTGLRFLAAFYVFIFHLDMPMRTPLTYLPGPVKALIEQGRLGVTVFFVLSGFLLSASFTQSYFPSVAMQWYDMGTWSVASELFFYVLFPLAAAATHPMANRPGYWRRWCCSEPYWG